MLALVGGGEEESVLHRLSERLGIQDRVRFAGWWTDLEAVYYGSDIIALSSDNEGTPVCLIEALACKRPVVATNVGGVADVLQDGRLGSLTPMGDLDAFANALTRMLDPAERTRSVSLAQESVVARYDVSRLIRDVENLYDRLLA